MIKLEKKLILFLEKHMILLAGLFLTGVAFLMRRQAIWYHSADYISYFDMHENNVQSALYYVLVRLAGYGFEIPLHGIKWLTVIADFVVAILCVLFYGKEFGQLKGIAADKNVYEKIKGLFLYAGCLFAPVMYLRGCVWAQVDSVALVFLIGAWYLSRGKGQQNAVGAAVLAGVGIAIYPCMIVPVAVFCICGKGKLHRRESGICLAAVIFAVLLEGISAEALQMSWQQGIRSIYRWMSYNPHTGELYGSVSEWLWFMVLLNGCWIAFISGIAAFRKKLPYVLAVLMQLVVTVCYGMALQW